jgi:hypothetical protein
MVKTKVDKMFDSFKKKGLLEDRSEYDADDLKSAYPSLTSKQAKKLYTKIQKWSRQ